MQNSKNLDNNKEFNAYADSYRDLHSKNMKIFGGEIDYFSEYKINEVAKFIEKEGKYPREILDFGCGIGNSIPFWRKYFRESSLTGGDVSDYSITVAQERFQGAEKYLTISDSIPSPDHSYDLVFSACVFHHIDEELHEKWLRELFRVTKKNGLLFIFEHNPLNPLTVHAVNTCEFDVNAKLIYPRVMADKGSLAGWSSPIIQYKLFFPEIFKKLRPLEKHLNWCFLGGQWCLIMRKNG